MEKDYYEILGIQKDATEKEIKKVYHKLAIKFHPDKAPEDKMEEYTQKFQQIGEAYEVLSNPDKKRIYDETGSVNFQENANPFDMFREMFGNFSFNGFAPSEKKVKKSTPVVHQVNLKLEDLFNGKSIKLKITKKCIFRKDLSEPQKDNLEETWDKCKICKGNGFKTQIKQIAPGFITQSNIQCQECSSSGSILKPNYELKDYQEIFEIKIERGMDVKKEHIIVEAGNCYPGTHPGDIIIVFQLVNHDKFHVRNSNLIMNQKILLCEALCGSEFIVKHLDNSLIKIKTKEIIKPGVIKTLKGRGMPTRNGCGDLIIIFDIEFPDSLLIHQKKNLKKFLPEPNKVEEEFIGETIEI